ncbi:hypothetical protein NP233_g12736 [Leucocoprinus birnbaumii]|uniref:DDE family endonuclease n=1 Tax=Leucocoprinus birnbaumii TaxID=56174 RepID=A0AAD5VJJ2_9AGAR|nr:hypothetical protein NP233_g12736 [Leucocoprinus birnbaumii]
MWIWSQDGRYEEIPASDPRPHTQRVVIWYHDESTFYANDCQKRCWQHHDEKGIPCPKGEGPSAMYIYFVSADYGWLESPDGKETAKAIFKAGKNCDGYFTNQEILAHVKKAMDILDKYYPHDKYVFVFDNVTTHKKRLPTAPSATRMPKGPSANFWSKVNILNEEEKAKLGPDGKQIQVNVQMGPRQFADGSPQQFYNEARLFKGTAQILKERGLINESKLNLTCNKDRGCHGMACCQRRVLYHQPDFADQTSALEAECGKHGYAVIFLPNFHCELNPIEPCWGHAKRVYYEYPLAQATNDLTIIKALEKNMEAAIKTVTVENIWKYACRAHRFLDAYHKGLSGKQAAWALRKYWGHQILPNSIMSDLSKAGL